MRMPAGSAREPPALKSVKATVRTFAVVTVERSVGRSMMEMVPSGSQPVGFVCEQSGLR